MRVNSSKQPIFSRKPLDYSKIRPDPINMGVSEKGTVIVNHILPSQIQGRVFPNLYEVTLKAKKLTTPDLEASDIEWNYKFQDPAHQVIKCQQVNKDKTILDRIKLIFIEQSISAFFQFVIVYFPQFVFLIYSLVVAAF